MSRFLHSRSSETEMESEQLPRQLIFCFLFDGWLWWRQAHRISPTRAQSADKLRQFVFFAEFARRCGELAELSVQTLSLHAVSVFVSGFCVCFSFWVYSHGFYSYIPGGAPEIADLRPKFRRCCFRLSFFSRSLTSFLKSPADWFCVSSDK